MGNRKRGKYKQFQVFCGTSSSFHAQTGHVVCKLIYVVLLKNAVFNSKLADQTSAVVETDLRISNSVFFFQLITFI